jgi:DNA-binding NtrC family response regulator
VKNGKFRKDLYYRLNVARIQIPPLRDRKEDIPDIVSLGIDKLNKRFKCDLKGFSDEAMASLFQHDWPGNIRELNNVVEASFIRCSSKKIQFTDLPPSFTKQLNFSNTYSASEKDILLAALCASRWNKSETAKKLKWNRMKVYRAMKRYNITEARK